MVVEQASVADTQRIIASCGYARPYNSEKWGVIQDYDRSAETPIQIFSPRNSNGLSWKKAFARMPAGFRINYADRNYGFGNRQVTVYRNGAPESDARIEQTTYDGLTDQTKVIQRAMFDLKQAQLRSAFYAITVNTEALRCRKGSLVGVNHDILAKHKGSGRIVETVVNGSNEITDIVLDSDINVINNEYMNEIANLSATDNLPDTGVKTAFSVVRTNGQISVHPVSNSNGKTNVLTLETPVADSLTAGSFFDKGNIPEIATGCLVVVGDVEKQYKRMIVTEIESGPDMTASLTLVDEAPEIWS
jgi:hypothetical protein